MSTTSTVQAFLNLEDSGAEVLFAQAPGSGAFLWPLARWPIANALASANLNVTSPSQSGQRTRASEYFKLIARELLPSPRQTNRLQEPVEHLFIVGGTTLTRTPQGVGNWMSDPFALPLGDRALVIQDAAIDLFTPRSGRPTNPRTWSSERTSTRVSRVAKTNPLSAAEKESAVDLLHYVYTQLHELLPSHFHDAITEEVLWRLARVRYEDAEFRQLLDRIQPQRIYMEEAAYGHHSNSVRRAHERGIEVAELQHGWIGASHAAYNFGGAWFDSPLTSSLPDTLLTFGDYWGEGLRFPGAIVPIGKPQLEKASMASSPYAGRRYRLLIVSSTYETDKLIAATLMLRQLLPESWEIALRPHPSERSSAVSLFAPALVSGVSLDDDNDVNDSIASSRAVVGMVSTVLFEALPLGVHIGVVETELAEFYANAKIFPRRLDAETSFREFARILTSEKAPDMKTVTSIWQPNAVDTFLKRFATA